MGGLASPNCLLDDNLRQQCPVLCRSCVPIPPTLSPTVKPTPEPTPVPSNEPTSAAPSYQPTLFPTAAPSASHPTLTPVSAVPTSPPTTSAPSCPLEQYLTDDGQCQTCTFAQCPAGQQRVGTCGAVINPNNPECSEIVWAQPLCREFARAGDCHETSGQLEWMQEFCPQTCHYCDGLNAFRCIPLCVPSQDDCYSCSQDRLR